MTTDPALTVPATLTLSSMLSRIESVIGSRLPTAPDRFTKRVGTGAALNQILQIVAHRLSLFPRAVSSEFSSPDATRSIPQL